MPEFLLEIGCEEIPAGWFSAPVDLRGQLRTAFQTLADQERLGPAGVEVLSTPRRLVLRSDVVVRQEDRTTTVFGPSAKAARDPNGGFSRAAQGFASKLGVRPEDLQAAPKDPGKPDELYLCHLRREEGRGAQEILPGVVAGLLRRLSFPKRMSWDASLEDGKGAFPFGRPIRWIVLLLGGEVVPLRILGEGGSALVESGRSSRGHRFLPRGAAREPLSVSTFDDLRDALRRRFVVLDPGERASRITEGLRRAGAPADHPLCSEWTELVEYPTVVRGRIPSEFITLPTEVLETVLVHHQKYIPVSHEGQVSRFAAVINTDDSPEIVRGMERVVVARLRDAAFFFAEDMKRPLAERVADLAGVTLHQGLGTYLAKSERLVRLVDIMGQKMGVLTRPEHDAAKEAARLAKADLTTLMVREFPELQGVMGGIYLRAQGNPWENVISAVRWHHHPISVDEGSPPAQALSGGEGTVFAAVSLADKLDTLAGYFGLGLIPTGSSDPYGLRRAAQGAIRVLLDFWQADAVENRPNLSKLAAEAVAGYAGALKNPDATVERDLRGFLLDRLDYVFVARGFPADEVAAVLHSPGRDPLEDPHDGWMRLRALHRVRETAREDFQHLAVAFKRAKNILDGQVPAAKVDASLFEGEAERGLHESAQRLSRLTGSYEERLRALSSIRGPVDAFFDGVLVMAEGAKVRANRLGLLAEVLSLFYQIADISHLGG